MGTILGYIKEGPQNVFSPYSKELLETDDMYALVFTMMVFPSLLIPYS